MTPFVVSRDVAAPLLTRAQLALSLTQTTLGALVGVTRRTVWRWQSGQSVPTVPNLETIARKVHAVDPALAGRLAEAAGATLESLGIAQPKPPEKPDPLADPGQSRILVDAVICAAAEAVDAPPRVARRALLAAFARAKEMGVPLDGLAAALSLHARRKPKPKAA
jgi:transcriptional regulator with XRE-family HTH domain